uniref:Uncharacterized protein n=1 Tax=Lactuca sativa TaxID=4236 RepID=A0A9R1VWC6_LACSA|nr:hypothetical protein LSAT_V11C400189470 [Lactuca sativa]
MIRYNVYPYISPALLLAHGANNDYNDRLWNQGFGNQYQRNPNGGFNNENSENYKEGNQFPNLYFTHPYLQSMASDFQLALYDDVSPILFTKGNKHHVELTPQLISDIFVAHSANNDYNDRLGNQGFGNQYQRNPNGGFNNANSEYYNECNQFPNLYFMHPNRQSFYPVSKIIEIIKAIQDFLQKPNEEFHDVLEHLKEFLCLCPHHNFPIGNLCVSFMMESTFPIKL